MLGKKKKSYATLTAPLQKMMSDLKMYVKEQVAGIKILEGKKRDIEGQINWSNLEITKSNATVETIGNMIITDAAAFEMMNKKEAIETAISEEDK